MRSRELAIGSVPCLALRITYVGELGWELYCGVERGLALWDTVWEGGREHGLVAGGYKAIDSLRREKGYRVWGSDITPDDTPFEAGLGFALDLKKPRGAEAMQRLLGTADVFVENSRPGAMARLGLGYDELSAANPALVYASISGYGQTGPHAEAPAMDQAVPSLRTSHVCSSPTPSATLL